MDQNKNTVTNNNINKILDPLTIINKSDNRSAEYYGQLLMNIIAENDKKYHH